MINWGVVPVGSVLPFMFSSYDGATGASEAISGLAVTDIEIFKGTSMTQRASDAGYTLLDTDGIDIDSMVGANGFSVDTGDNTDAGFYAAGSFYNVWVASITADGQTVNFLAGTFGLRPAETAAGVPKVDVSHFGGKANNAAGGLVSQVIAAGTLPSQASVNPAVGEVALESGAITADDQQIGKLLTIFSASHTIRGSAIISDSLNTGDEVVCNGGEALDFTPTSGDTYTITPLPGLTAPTSANPAPVNVIEVAGAAQTAGDLAALLTAIQVYPKNVAVAKFGFAMYLTDGTLATGVTVAGVISKDGGNFASITDSPTEIQTSGCYEVDIAQAEMNADEILLKFTGTGCRPLVVKIRTQA